MKTIYETGERFLKRAENELKVLQYCNVKLNVLERMHRIARIVELLSKAVIHAASIETSKDRLKRHDVSELLIDLLRAFPTSLTDSEKQSLVTLAMLNAMLCNNTIWNVSRYEIEQLGLTLEKHKIKDRIEQLIEAIEDFVKQNLIEVIRSILKKLEFFVIELTRQDFDSQCRSVIKEIPIRPTSKYAHAGVKLRLCNDLIDHRFSAIVKFYVKSTASVRCEVCIWGKKRHEDRGVILLNDDGTKSPRDYAYGPGKVTIRVEFGKLSDAIANEIEPRVWRQGDVKIERIVVEICRVQ